MLSSFQWRIRKVVKLVGNAQQLADRTQISRRMIGEYLAGNSEPTMDRLITIANAAFVNLKWLATGEGPMLVGSQTIEPDATEGPADEAMDEQEMLVRWVQNRWGRLSPIERGKILGAIAAVNNDFAAWEKKHIRRVSSKATA